MNKNLKRIIAFALVFGTISAVAPATNFNLLTTKAYASTDSNDELLTRLKLKTSSGTLKLYEDSGYDSDEKVDPEDISDDGEYYAKTSAKKLTVDVDGPENKFVKVFNGKSKSTKGKSVSSDISLDEGTNTITVKVYSEKPGSSVQLDDDDDLLQTVTVKVKCKSSSYDDDDNDADDYADIYLSKLSVDGESIKLSEDKVTYTYKVPSETKEVSIKAVPQDEDDNVVEINDDKVDDEDKWKTTVSLDKGENDITIHVEEDDDDDEYRDYTLKITRADEDKTKSDKDDTQKNTGDTQAQAVTPVVAPLPVQAPTTMPAARNQWVKIMDGVWQYYDENGTPKKNTWYYDVNYAKNYYFLENGNMATGWLPFNQKYYYLGTDGSMKTGWQQVGQNWYYLNVDGTMAYNTTINTTSGAYKLGPNGAWIQ